MLPKKITLSLVGLAVLIGAVAASAAEIDPAAYREEVEPICKTNAEANEKILKDVRKHVKEGKVKKASRQLFSAAKALKLTREQLLKVPKPTEDAALLTRWLKGVKVEVELLEATGRKLAHGERNAAVRLVVRLEDNADKTNILVRNYDFRYCRFQPAKFL